MKAMVDFLQLGRCRQAAFGGGSRMSTLRRENIGHATDYQ